MAEQQDQVWSGRTSVRRRLRPVSTSEEEEDEEGPSTSGGKRIAPTLTDQEHYSGATARVEAVDIEVGGGEPDPSGQGVVESYSPPDYSPVGIIEVPLGQANTQPGPAFSPFLLLEAPIPSRTPAASPATSPPHRSCQLDHNIGSGPEAPHPSCPTQAPPCVVPPVAVPEDLMWACEGQPQMSSRIILQLCLEIRMMREEIVRALATLTTSFNSLATAMSSVVSQLPSHTTSPCPLANTVTPRASRPRVVPVPATASRVPESHSEDLDIVVVEDDQKDT